MSKEWKQRVYNERAELKDKYIKLGHSLDTAQNIDPQSMDLLREQYDIMQQYLRVLDKRIHLWLK